MPRLIFEMFSVLLLVRAKIAPKPFVPKKQMQFHDCSKLVQTPAPPQRRERRFENLLEKRLPEDRKYSFLLDFLSGRDAEQKMLPKSPPEASRRASRAALGSPRRPKIDQLFASGRPPGTQHQFFGSPRGFKHSAKIERGGAKRRGGAQEAPGSPQGRKTDQKPAKQRNKSAQKPRRTWGIAFSNV